MPGSRQRGIGHKQGLPESGDATVKWTIAGDLLHAVLMEAVEGQESQVSLEALETLKLIHSILGSDRRGRERLRSGLDGVRSMRFRGIQWGDMWCMHVAANCLEVALDIFTDDKVLEDAAVLLATADNQERFTGGHATHGIVEYFTALARIEAMAPGSLSKMAAERGGPLSADFL